MYHPDSTVDRCEDKADWCRYANCLRIKPFVAKRCQKTCNICQPAQPGAGPGSNLAEIGSFANSIDHFLSLVLLIIIIRTNSHQCYTVSSTNCFRANCRIAESRM